MSAVSAVRWALEEAIALTEACVLPAAEELSDGGVAAEFQRERLAAWRAVLAFWPPEASVERGVAQVQAAQLRAAGVSRRGMH